MMYVWLAQAWWELHWWRCYVSQKPAVNLQLRRLVSKLV